MRGGDFEFILVRQITELASEIETRCPEARDEFYRLHHGVSLHHISPFYDRKEEQRNELRRPLNKYCPPPLETPLAAEQLPVSQPNRPPRRFFGLLRR